LFLLRRMEDVTREIASFRQIGHQAPFTVRSRVCDAGV
jgi:hypothetical protein